MKKYIAIGLCLAALIAMTRPNTGFASGYSPVTIAQIILYQGGGASPPYGALVQLTTSPSDTEGCTHSSSGYAWVDFTSTTQPDGKTVYAALLAAELAGKSVNIGVTGCNSQGYPLVYAVGVYQ
jgi:hypothetical protein